jgi:hypothetical protein
MTRKAVDIGDMNDVRLHHYNKRHESSQTPPGISELSGEKVCTPSAK